MIAIGMGIIICLAAILVVLSRIATAQERLANYWDGKRGLEINFMANSLRYKADEDRKRQNHARSDGFTPPPTSLREAIARAAGVPIDRVEID